MKIELESTSERCHYNGPRAPGERFFAKESEAVVLTGLGRAKRVFPPIETPPAPAGLETLAAGSGRGRKGRPRGTEKNPKQKRGYKRRDMQAEG